MLLNGFRAVDAKDTYTDYRQFRWSPGLLLKTENSESFFISSPLTYSSTGPDHLMTKEALDWNVIITSGSRKAETGKFNWSYGLLALDLTKRSRVFPIIGLSYLSSDGLWRTAFGYPAFSVTFLGQKDFEYSLFFSRELNRYKIDDQNPLFVNGEFIEKNLNKVGVSATRSLNQFLKASLSYSLAFNSESRFLDASHTANGNNYLDYSGDGFLQISIGLGFNRTQ